MKTSKKLYIAAVVCYMMGAVAMVCSAILIFRYKQSFIQSSFLSGFAMAISATSMVYSAKGAKFREDHDDRKEQLEKEIEEIRNKGT